MKILFISHDASRTGAPILLLHLADVLLQENIRIDFLLKHGGSLEKDFRAKGKTQVFYKTYRSLTGRIRKKVFKPGARDLSGLDWKEYDFVISNTFTNGDILPYVRKHYKGPIVSYIHELQMALGFFTKPALIEASIQCSDFYLAPCIAVKDFLVRNYPIQPQEVAIMPYFIPARSHPKNLPDKTEKTFFHVGGSGTVDWRKSPDLFVQVASTVFSKIPDANIRFLWKGAPQGGVELDRIKYDIQKAGLNGKIDFIPASSDMAAFYLSLDVFLLTSREDPYPLVVLEAADAAVPTICFEEAGGSPEFVKASGGGFCVKYLDTVAMADAIIHYYKNSAEKDKAGSAAKNRLSETHQDRRYILDQFEFFVKKLNK